VPTGRFAYIPLHAAGVYSDTQTSIGVSDFVISSYTPTITAVLNARKRNHSLKKADAKGLLVSTKTAPGMSTLRFVDGELDAVAHVFPDGSTKTYTESMVNNVLEEIPEASIIHLACHGTQDPKNPLESGFHLADGTLSVAQIMRLHLPNGFLAFLSACETAKGDSGQPDQAIHLTAAMLFAGFASVVGTMWYTFSLIFRSIN
jgi:CHAT domain-containing protein